MCLKFHIRKLFLRNYITQNENSVSESEILDRLLQVDHRRCGSRAFTCNTSVDLFRSTKVMMKMRTGVIRAIGTSKGSRKMSFCLSCAFHCRSRVCRVRICESTSRLRGGRGRGRGRVLWLELGDWRIAVVQDTSRWMTWRMSLDDMEWMYRDGLLWRNGSNGYKAEE